MAQSNKSFNQCSLPLPDNMAQHEVTEPQFHKIVDGINGSEGPVFTRDGRFFCVAPEVTPGQPGAIIQVDLEKNTVRAIYYF